MKTPIFILASIVICMACGHDSSKEKKAPVAFFPVTGYLKGQINEMKKVQSTPLKKWTIDNISDSTFLKPEQLDAAFSEFTAPVIDSLHYASIFEENNFLDETQNAVTLIYEPIGEIPNNIPWLKWTIYISPTTNQVTKVYMVKKVNNQQTKQLTWKVKEKNCLIRSIVEDPSKDTSFITNETTINWNY
jgi:hypothetical protein